MQLIAQIVADGMVDKETERHGCLKFLLQFLGILTSSLLLLAFSLSGEKRKKGGGRIHFRGGVLLCVVPSSPFFREKSQRETHFR